MALSTIGFSAPKLVPMVLLMQRFPRLAGSGESLSLKEYFFLLTKPHEIPMRDWQWHENGSYMGIGPVIVMLLALVLPSPRKTRAFRVHGVFVRVGLAWVRSLRMRRGRCSMNTRLSLRSTCPRASC